MLMQGSLKRRSLATVLCLSALALTQLECTAVGYGTGRASDLLILLLLKAMSDLPIQ
jgi:hypothetical protein